MSGSSSELLTFNSVLNQRFIIDNWPSRGKRDDEYIISSLRDTNNSKSLKYTLVSDSLKYKSDYYHDIANDITSLYGIWDICYISNSCEIFVILSKQGGRKILDKIHDGDKPLKNIIYECVKNRDLYGLVANIYRYKISGPSLDIYPLYYATGFNRQNQRETLGYRNPFVPFVWFCVIVAFIIVISWFIYMIWGRDHPHHYINWRKDST